MSLIGKEVIEFKANAFHNGEFIEVSNEDFKGHLEIIILTRYRLIVGLKMDN